MAKKIKGLSEELTTSPVVEYVIEDPDSHTVRIVKVDSTGKIVSESKPSRKYAKNVREFLKLFEEAGAYIAKQKLSGQQLSILFLILSNLDYNNFVRVSQKEIAEELGLHFQKVSGAMRRLVEVGILEEGPRVNMCKTYRMNPRIARKGREPAKLMTFPSRKGGPRND